MNKNTTFTERLAAARARNEEVLVQSANKMERAMIKLSIEYVREGKIDTATTLLDAATDFSKETLARLYEIINPTPRPLGDILDEGPEVFDRPEK